MANMANMANTFKSKEHSVTRSSAFLVELLIVVLFFAIASVVTIRLFVAAHDKSMESQVLVNAVAQTQSVAEAIKATDSPEQALSLLYGGKVHSSVDNSFEFEVYFDEFWQVASVNTDANLNANLNSNPSYILKVEYELTKQGAGELLSAFITAFKQDKTQIYQLAIADYIAG